MEGDPLDPALARGLGSAAQALREWGLQKDISYRLDRWLTHGRSTAIVAQVYETDHHLGGSRKLLLKLDVVPNEAIGVTEYRRQREALRDAPTFAQDHLAELAEPGHDLVRIGDGRWIVFQTVAAGGPGELSELDIVTKPLASVRAGGPVVVTGSTAVDVTIECDGRTFGDLCGQIVGAVLRDWAIVPHLRPMSAADYIGLHLGNRAATGQPLHALANSLPNPWLRFPHDYETLPNPFAITLPGEPAADQIVQAALGKTHGDLHTGNILVPFRSVSVPSPFCLIDLAKYDPMGPLARDPVYLLLYVVLRVLPDLDDKQRAALPHVLVSRNSDRGRMLPPWLQHLIGEVRKSADSWIAPFGLGPEWRLQQQLSLLACALIFLSRASTRAADRLWLLYVAALAAAAFRGPDGLQDAGSTTTVTDAIFSRTGTATERVAEGHRWVARFCEFLPYMEPRARDRGRTADLEALTAAARLGEDRTDDYVELVRVLGGPTDDLRDPADDDPPTDEVYTCPRQAACPRVEHRPSGEREPRCALSTGAMMREFW